jgi:S1-C subfamily serine protease
MLLCALCLVGGPSGCSILGIGLSRAPDRQIEPTTPIWRRPSASDLTGLSLTDIATRADQTLEDVPLSSNTIRGVAERAMPAVVSIYTKTATDYRVSLLPVPIPGLSFRFPLPGEALGSAFFVHPNGYLLSNNHVIANAVSIQARTPNDEDHEIEVIARDPVLDIALLRIANGEEGPFPFLPIGASKEVGVGDSVVAIGNPLGLGHSVSQGIISQTGRELVKLEDTDARQIEFLQTDTAINPGSSGGPLITLTGAVVGMNTAIARSAQGIAFAVPSSQIIEFVEQVLRGEGVADPATE